MAVYILWLSLWVPLRNCRIIPGSLGRKGVDKDVPFRAEHSAVIYSVTLGFSMHCNHLHEQASLVRFEICTSITVGKREVVSNRFILCPTTREIVVDFPLGAMTCQATGCRLQNRALNPRREWLVTPVRFMSLVPARHTLSSRDICDFY